MLPRERVLTALDFRAPDVVPLQIYPAHGGLYEHGQKLVDLIRACGHDFGDLSGLSMPPPLEPADVDADGRYHAFKTDAWGTTWEYRIPGIWGHPVAWPLADLSKLDGYEAPPPPPVDGAGLECARRAAAAHQERYFLLCGGGSIFERLHSVRRFEDVLMDICLDTPEINRIVDLIAENTAAYVTRAVACGADAVSFGDDYGTQTAPLLSPDVWRRFFKPRYRALFEPVVRAGKHIFFHSCGQVRPLLEDLREIGVTAIWPQLPLFDFEEFSAFCRELGLALQLHPDRGELMQHGTPSQVREYVLRMLEAFDTRGGGSWLYLEVDPGFPYENVEALFETAMEVRGVR